MCSNRIYGSWVSLLILPAKKVVSDALHDVEGATYEQDLITLAPVVVLRHVFSCNMVQSLDDVTTFN